MNLSSATKIDLAYLLKELIQMPTITREKATSRAALDWVKYQVRELPLHVTEFTYNGYSALILTTRPTRRPKVLLSAHIDVAPASPESFTLREENGRYYGRGVFDMKFAIAAYLQLLLELGDDLPRYDLGVVLTSDEEDTGGSDGAGQLVKAGWGADVILNPDAIMPGWAIQRASKGILRYRVKSTGQLGHGSRPWVYRNAIGQLMDYLRDLESRFAHEPCGDPTHSHATLNVGVINGGHIPNQVPAAAHADIDIRFMPGSTTEQTADLVQAVGAEHPHISFEFLAGDEPVELDTSVEYVSRLQGIITEVAGVKPEFVLAHGATESGYYTAKGIPVLMFEPPGGGHHADDEWISVPGVEQFARVVREFVEQEARTV